MTAPHMFAIGSPVWPGLSKLNEECGEVIQVIGKLMATGGDVDHWEGAPLDHRLTEELGDLKAAIDFVLCFNESNISTDAVIERGSEKFSLFCTWHHDQAPDD